MRGNLLEGLWMGSTACVAGEMHPEIEGFGLARITHDRRLFGRCSYVAQIVFLHGGHLAGRRRELVRLTASLEK